MPLVQNELVIAPRTIARRVARGALLLVTTTLAGVVVLAAAAYASRDTTRGVPSPPQLVVADAGPPAVKAEPQVPPDDVLAIVTVATEPDAGSPFVAAPPVDAQAVASLVSAVAQSCLIDALRFDPAIGGTIVVTVTLAAAGSDSDHSTRWTPRWRRCFRVVFPRARGR